jgi:cytochrome c553
MRIHHGLALLAFIGLPVAVPAASPAQQDYQEAMNKVPDLARGAREYVTCTGCHRENGRGNLDGSVPLIAGQHFRVLVKQIADYRHARRWDPRMQHYADNHFLPDTQAIADVAAYISQLDPRGTSGTGQGDQLALGREIHARRCAACHGRAGEGNGGEGIPRLAGQHYAYTLRQLHDFLEGRRPRLTPDHVPMIKDLVRDELTGLADAQSRLQVPAP